MVMCWLMQHWDWCAAAGEGSGSITGDAQAVLGACAVDVATGQMLIGQW